MRPGASNIAVPPFWHGLAWVGRAPAPVDRICARGPLLVHFIDAAHLSSVRTLPYLAAWHERYAGHGLTVCGVNSPRFPFTGEPDKLAASLERLEVPFPVAVDSEYRTWRDYGCEGWPSLFLWGRGGALRWFHFGEGEYVATEEAIQEELRNAAGTDLGLPEVLAPLRPSDEPGALVARPTDEILPGGSISAPWRATGELAELAFKYEAGGAWASVDGEGTLEVSLDGAPARQIVVDAPGAYELASHPRHDHHGLSVRPSPTVDVYAIAFAAGLPAES